MSFAFNFKEKITLDNGKEFLIGNFSENSLTVHNHAGNLGLYHINKFMGTEHYPFLHFGIEQTISNWDKNRDVVVYNKDTDSWLPYAEFDTLKTFVSMGARIKDVRYMPECRYWSRDKKPTDTYTYVFRAETYTEEVKEPEVSPQWDSLAIKVK